MEETNERVNPEIIDMSKIQIKVGDYVRHKTNPNVNGGLKMEVGKSRPNPDDENSSEFRISWIDIEGVHKIQWYREEDLELVE